MISIYWKVPSKTCLNLFSQQNLTMTFVICRWILIRFMQSVSNNNPYKNMDIFIVISLPTSQEQMFHSLKMSIFHTKSSLKHEKP